MSEFQLIHHANERLGEMEPRITEAHETLARIGEGTGELERRLGDALGSLEAVQETVTGLAGVVDTLQQALAPHVKLTAPVTAKAQSIKVANTQVLSGDAAALVNNNTTRLNEIEAALRQVGVVK